jgi:hypothetical protein
MRLIFTVVALVLFDARRVKILNKSFINVAKLNKQARNSMFCSAGI